MKEIEISGNHIEVSMLEKAQIIPFGTPPAQIIMFAHQCKVLGLDPINKEVFLIKRNSKQGDVYSLTTSLAGMQKKANQTGLYAGCSDVVYNKLSNGSFKTKAELNGQLPITAHVTIYKIVQGQKVGFENSVSFNEFYGNASGFSMARTMPYVMIDKVVKMRALKDAFAAELSGLGIEEEADAIEGKTVYAESVEVGINSDDLNDAKKKVSACGSRNDLKLLYNSNPNLYSKCAELFIEKQKEIDENNAPVTD